ncbi:lysine histidine transporter-like 8 [Prunus yedoensis var. nudiflora]|uniref:Lysine histidine transporter-like 8 n=1 Tax=Prunus yedoensis var. nudiflora TaxID=2094558 RepID=A0A314Z433_PRUYE|nr:lysine histidine transporter-like 8 [Prunus yedoensis var. nudiflora]
MADMEEVVVEANCRPEETRATHPFRSSSNHYAQVIPITTSPPPTREEDGADWGGGELNPQDAWLPITESRNGNTISATFHLICSGIGIQALLLPLAFATLVMFPNLNSIAWVSFIGAITAVGYCTLIWALSIGKGRPSDISYNPPEMDSNMDRFGGIMNSIGIIFITFRGHNVMLEIQGTLPSSSKHPSHKQMWRGVTVSYALIAMCLLPLAIAGFWAYGNKIPSSYGKILSSVSNFHGHKTSTFVLGLICIIIVINCLSTFQIYSMVVFDNLEFKYTSRKSKPCTRWLRMVFRFLFGGVAFFAAVALPFLPLLAPLIGGMTLPLAYAYPCFIWIAIKKPQPRSGKWCINMGLGCLGLVLSVVLVVAAIWNLTDKGLNANFFKP